MSLNVKEINSYAKILNFGPFRVMLLLVTRLIDHTTNVPRVSFAKIEDVAGPSYDEEVHQLEMRKEKYDVLY